MGRAKPETARNRRRALDATANPALRWPDLEIVLTRLAAGDTLNAICREERTRRPDFPAPATVRLWYVADQPAGFAARYVRARESQAEAWSDSILDLADESSRDTKVVTRDDGSEYEVADHEWMNRSKLRVDTRKWLMAKLHPTRYGDSMELRGNPTTPLVVRFEE